MFEDFSFLSSSSTISAHPQFDPFEPISPLSPIPLSSQRSCDRRFHSARTPSIESLAGSSRRLSIDTLTSQFDSHAIDSPRDEFAPRSTPLEEDEGFDEPSYNHTASYFPSMDMINNLDYSLTNPTSPSSTTKVPLTISARRRQRQLLTRLQCLSNTGGLDAHLAIVLEECHPSSLPFQSSDSGTGNKGGRKQSITSAGTTATSPLSPGTACVRKNRAIVKRAPRLRKRKD